MAPRRNRSSHPAAELNVRAARAGLERREDWAGTEWIVRPTGGSDKTYRCPGCDHEIAPNATHVVAWPADFRGVGERRHWHTACWRARDRRH